MSKLKITKSINSNDSLNQLLLLKEICSKIYIARNISLSEDTIQEQLKRIDELFRDKDNYN
jgi:hypothetical protein